ncbi:MAG: DUF445 family protein [Firmicutes bacterium]|nr:DUF445 family protein [Bacillota bacterium]
MTWELMSFPFIAALIGWGTNVIAIKMLFWPRQPIRIFGFSLRGVLPKRQKEIASSIGQIVNEDLLPSDDLLEAVNTKENREKIVDLICGNLEDKAGRFLPFFIPENAKEKIKGHLRGIVGSEIETLFSQLSTTFSTELETRNLLGNLVEEKVNSFDFFQLENLILKVAKKELRHIEFLGAVLGFFIGIIQVLILMIF